MKILIAEDDVVSRRRLEANLLNWGYDVIVTVDGDEAWLALQGEEAPRLAILDWMMPGMDGVKVCERVRQHKVEPYTYIVILTAKDRKEDVVLGLEAGADDYLTKPYDAHELKARLRAGRRILALQEALLSARDALRFQVTLDPLTGVWNRTAILDTLKRELFRAEREETSLSVFMVNLDHFNRVNDAHGRMAGDSVLRETARRIQLASRVYDPVGRSGGEEFIIIAPGCDAAGALLQGERIRASISDKPIDLSEGMIQQTVSVGYVTASNVRGMASNSLLSAAAAALLQAKELGRNRVELGHAAEFQGITLLKWKERVVQQRSQNGGRAVTTGLKRNQA